MQARFREAQERFQALRREEEVTGALLEDMEALDLRSLSAEQQNMLSKVYEALQDAGGMVHAGGGGGGKSQGVAVAGSGTHIWPLRGGQGSAGDGEVREGANLVTPRRSGRTAAIAAGAAGAVGTGGGGGADGGDVQMEEGAEEGGNSGRKSSAMEGRVGVARRKRPLRKPLSAVRPARSSKSKVKGAGKGAEVDAILQAMAGAEVVERQADEEQKQEPVTAIQQDDIKASPAAVAPGTAFQKEEQSAVGVLGGAVLSPYSEGMKWAARSIEHEHAAAEAHLQRRWQQDCAARRTLASHFAVNTSSPGLAVTAEGQAAPMGMGLVGGLGGGVGGGTAVGEASEEIESDGRRSQKEVEQEEEGLSEDEEGGGIGEEDLTAEDRLKWELVQPYVDDMREGERLANEAEAVVTNTSVDFADTLKDAHPAGSVWDAVEKGHTARVLAALASGEVTLLDEDPHEFGGKTLLHLAAWWGHVDMMAALVERGANASGVDGIGFTPLHYAAMTGRERAVEALLSKHSVLVDPLTCTGCSPLHFAAWGGHIKATAKLAEYGANLLLASDKGTTPLQMASAHAAPSPTSPASARGVPGMKHAPQHFQTAELLRRLLGVDAPAMDGLEVFAAKTLHF